jgi:hypothetical protein
VDDRNRAGGIVCLAIGHHGRVSCPYGVDLCKRYGTNVRSRLICWFLARNSRGRLGVIKAVIVTFERDRLMARPLAELHAIASKLGIERFRLLRRPDLADAILVGLQLRDGVDKPPDTPVQLRGDRRARHLRRRRGFGPAGSAVR